MNMHDTRNLRAEALRILQESFDKLVKENPDYQGVRGIEQRLVDDVFNCAWENQFRDDPSKFKREIRKIIRQATGAGNGNSGTQD